MGLWLLLQEQRLRHVRIRTFPLSTFSELRPHVSSKLIVRWILAQVAILIIDKRTQRQIQAIRYYSTHLYGGDFKDCQSARSYSTGKNQDAAVSDNDFGDIVVADFNFDGRDDFAIKKESANRGAVYTYYVQDSDGHFSLDTFLTETVSWGPYKLNAANKTLQTLIIANVRYMGETTYRFNTKSRKWKKNAQPMGRISNASGNEYNR